MEHYSFFIRPHSVLPVPNTTSSYSYKIYMSYNTLYNISIYAINCVGVSKVTTLSNIRYGKLVISSYTCMRNS